MIKRGACRCRGVTFAVDGEPVRCGLCHCLDCRARSGAPFVLFVVFNAEQVAIRGARVAVDSTTGRRQACAACGAIVLWADDEAQEIELYAGHFDAPGLFAPSYELWVTRREPWLAALPVPQFAENRPRRP
ncbi:GFA family protein [Luteibacter sp.]|uniref:GFA family protein n=1 Tax=Luteibacter sp. TaxID=1886636 RepID=UPI003F7F190D